MHAKSKLHKLHKLDGMQIKSILAAMNNLKRTRTLEPHSTQVGLHHFPYSPCQ